jgi:hypothetical protein
MSDIKSINHQNIHSTQSASTEPSHKTSEIVKESKPAEFRPFSSEQKESIKQTRNAENKFAESATRAMTEAKLFPGIDVAAGSDPSQTGPIVSQMKDAIEKLVGKANPPPSSPIFGVPHIYPNPLPTVRELGAAAVAADGEEKTNPSDMLKDDKKGLGESIQPSPRKYIDRDDMIKSDEAKDSKSGDLLPIGTGPTGELPDLHDLKSGLKKVDKYLKPVTDVIREKIKGDS